MSHPEDHTTPHSAAKPPPPTGHARSVPPHEARVDPAAVRSGRSVGTLLRDLSGELSSLFRKEGALARAELRAKLDQFGSGAAEIGAGALLTFAGFLVLLEAAVFGLALVVPFWLSAAIVGGTVLLIGLIVLARGRSNLKSENLTPERTLGSLRRDAEMARSEAERLRTREGDDETRYGPQGPRSH